MKPHIFSVYRHSIAFLIWTIALSSVFGKGTTPTLLNHNQTQPIHKLIARILPGHEDQFTLELKPAENEKRDAKEFFTIETVNGKVHLTGNTPSALSTGFNHYLKYTALIDVSWWGSDAVRTLETLPLPKEKTTRTARTSNRFFLNYCTYGYTFPYWRWNDWERMIDWMALNGVTMPLATAGQEAIWQRVWKKFGLTDQQIRSYFTGPAHLGWHRMANIDGWGGPLPQSYINGQEALQKKLLARMRSLGMTPVLPAFAGHVPAALRTSRPKAKISNIAPWSGHSKQYNTCILDIMDPLFTDIQKAFIEEQTRTFGSDHIYGIDPFNELKPPSWDPAYLAGMSKTIYKSLSAADPKATWVQMGWLFYHSKDKWTPERIKAFLTAVPQDKMILLDYFCETTEIWKTVDSFYGQPFIWCYLGNFGGNPTFGGALKIARDRFSNALKNARSCRGIGSTLEGIDRNPLCYEYIFELAWEGNHTDDIDLWVENYGKRRAGTNSPEVAKAWRLLSQTCYQDLTFGGKRASILNSRPFLIRGASTAIWNRTPGKPSTHHTHRFKMETLKDILRGLLAAPQSALDNPTHQHDIQQIALEIINERATSLQDALKPAYMAHDANKLAKIRDQFMELFDLKDALMHTRSEMRLATWVNDARSWGVTAKEKNDYEANAKNIITLWSLPNSNLNDYATRDWSGLVGNYHKQRWKIYLDAMVRDARKGQGLNPIIWKDVLAFESSWYKQPGNYPSPPEGNLISLSKKLLDPVNQ